MTTVDVLHKVLQSVVIRRALERQMQTAEGLRYTQMLV
jgi:hypothetical protein